MSQRHGIKGSLHFGLLDADRQLIEVLAERDVKGLYKKALAGEIPNFTGVSDPYEPPAQPEVVTHSDTETIEESAEKVLAYLADSGLIDPIERQHGH